jgi:hypothetical protein
VPRMGMGRREHRGSDRSHDVPPFMSSIFTWVPGLPVDDHAIAYALPRTHDTPVVGAVTPIAPLMVPVITAPMFWNAPLSGRHRARRFPGPRFG